jgi:beta-lactamase superfamily II metal-dependent hydrolase
MIQGKGSFPLPRVHFLNVNDGDCSLIEHASRRNTMIDVSAAKMPSAKRAQSLVRLSLRESFFDLERLESVVASVPGNFNRSEHPVNPIVYMKERGIHSIFRFISTHPDMDHLDGIEALFRAFSPDNFWDTDNTKELSDFADGGYQTDDWDFYVGLRDGKPTTNPKRLALYAGSKGAYYNQGEFGVGGGDGLHILAPTPELVADANQKEDWNDSSYVILYRPVNDKRILFAGDSHDGTWNHILTNYWSDVENIDVLIAPHHGRDSGRDYTFLDVLRPKLTLFGNAPSEHLAYEQWNRRNLPFITNNQAGNILLDIQGPCIDVCVEHKPFAKTYCEENGTRAIFMPALNAWQILQLA